MDCRQCKKKLVLKNNRPPPHKKNLTPKIKANLKRAASRQGYRNIEVIKNLILQKCGCYETEMTEHSCVCLCVCGKDLRVV